MDADFIKSVESGKMRKGKGSLLKYLKGKRLTRQQSIDAKCYDCNGMGDQDECDIVECGLYPYSPYKIKSTAPSTGGCRAKKRK